MRSMAGSSSQQPQQQQRTRQPPAPQVTTNEEYGAIAEEDRDHVDEVVSYSPNGLSVAIHGVEG